MHTSQRFDNTCVFSIRWPAIVCDYFFMIRLLPAFPSGAPLGCGFEILNFATEIPHAISYLSIYCSERLAAFYHRLRWASVVRASLQPTAEQENVSFTSAYDETVSQTVQIWPCEFANVEGYLEGQDTAGEV